MTLESKLIGSGAYIQVDNQMTFPNPLAEEINNIEWSLRHNPYYTLSHGDAVYLASFLSAYREIVIYKNQKNRNDCCSAIRKAAVFNPHINIGVLSDE